MLMPRKIEFGISLLLLATTVKSDSVKERQRRNLIHTPYVHIVQLILGTGVPIPLEADQAMTMGWVLKATYLTPNNASIFTNPYVSLQKRSISDSSVISRFDLYRFLDGVFEILGGKGCVLRAICQASQLPFKASSILGHIMHIIFSPSSTDEKPVSSGDHEYMGASNLGKDPNLKCEMLYPECLLSPIDILTVTS